MGAGPPKPISPDSPSATKRPLGHETTATKPYPASAAPNDPPAVPVAGACHNGAKGALGDDPGGQSRRVRAPGLASAARTASSLPSSGPLSSSTGISRAARSARGRRRRVPASTWSRTARSGPSRSSSTSARNRSGRPGFAATPGLRADLRRHARRPAASKAVSGQSSADVPPHDRRPGPARGAEHTLNRPGISGAGPAVFALAGPPAQEAAAEGFFDRLEQAGLPRRRRRLDMGSPCSPVVES